MRDRTKQRILNVEISIGQETLREIYSGPIYHGNANQNDSDSYTYHNSEEEKLKS